MAHNPAKPSGKVTTSRPIDTQMMKTSSPSSKSSTDMNSRAGGARKGKGRYGRSR